MANFNTWASYFYPPPDAGTLRNLRDIRDPEALSAFEYASTMRRAEELHAAPSIVSRTFDAAHVSAIHRYLFQDVYEWAGEFRSVNMGKDGDDQRAGFADVDTGEVGRYLNDVHGIVERTEWARLTRREFGRATAEVFAHLNQAHPFREGNGRTAKVFLGQVTEQARFFALDFSRVDPDEWNFTSELSRPAPGSYAVEPGPLEPMFLRMVTPRPTGPSLPGEGGTGRA